MNFKHIFEKWKIKMDVHTILGIWNESSRHFHNLNHLNDLIEKINKDAHSMTEKQYEQLILTAVFHDIVYDVMSNLNEEKSAEFFLSVCENKDSGDVREIYDAIIATKTHKANSELSEKFNKYDMSIVESSFDDLVKWEEGISAEYLSVYDKNTYKNGRVKFLESLLNYYPLNSGNLLSLIELVKNEY